MTRNVKYKSARSVSKVSISTNPNENKTYCSPRNLFFDCRPRLFAEFAGNEEFKRQFASMLRTNAVPAGMVLTAPAGCGKTSAGHLVIRRIYCWHGEPTDLDTCPECLDNEISETVTTVNCRTLTSERLAEVLDQARQPGALAQILIDDAHLATEPIVDQLLTFLEDPSEGAALVLALVEGGSLNEALLQRLCHFPIAPPSSQEAAVMLRRISQQIGGESVEEDVLEAIAVQHRRVPRTCIMALIQVVHLGIRTLDEFNDRELPRIVGAAQL